MTHAACSPCRTCRLCSDGRIQTAKAYAAQPDVAAKLKEFKVVRPARTSPRRSPRSTTSSTSGYDAIVTDAQNPAAFKPVIKRANDAGVVLVAFDNTLDTDQGGSTSMSTRRASAYYWAKWLD